MSETIERYGIEINAKVEKALQALARLESQNKKTKETLEKTQKAGTDSANALGGAFDNLKGKLLGLLAVGAFTSFIKKLAESNLQIKIMADRLGMTAKNVKGMQQAFKSVGQDESLANAAMDDWNKSYALAKYKGQYTGIAAIANRFGVKLNDANGNQKDIVDLHSDIGQAAIRRNHGDRQAAIQNLIAENMDPNLASMITKDDYKELIRAKQEDAVVSDKAAEAAKKWADFTERFNNRAAEAIERLDEQIGLWDGLNKTLDLVFDIGTAVDSIMEQLGQTFQTVGTICENIGKVLESLFGSIDYEKLASILGMDDQMADAHQALAAEGYGYDIPETHQPTGAQMAAKDLPHGAGKMVYTPGKFGTLHRRNNFGNIMGKDGRLKTYSNVFDSIKDTVKQVKLYGNKGFSIREMLYMYAPYGHGSNDPERYTRQLAQLAGVDPDANISSFSNAQLARVIAGIGRIEQGAQGVDPRLIMAAVEMFSGFRGVTGNNLGQKHMQQIVIHAHSEEAVARLSKRTKGVSAFTGAHRR